MGGLLDDGSLENREILHGFEMFPKPFRAAELLDKVKEVLAGHHSEQGGEKIPREHGPRKENYNEFLIGS